MLGRGLPDRPLACTLYGVSDDSSRDDLAHVIDNLLCIVVNVVHRSSLCIAPGLWDQFTGRRSRWRDIAMRFNINGDQKLY